MLVNPDIQAWFQKLQGQPLVRGGSAPRGQGLPSYGSDVLTGIVKPGTGMFGFNAPSIMANYRPVQPLPNPGMRGMMGTPPVQPTSEGLAPGMNLGGAAIAGGYEKLGQGIAKAAGDIAAKQKAKQADLDAAAAAGLDKPNAFGTAPTPPGRPGEPTPPARPTGLGSPPPTFPPIGTASTLPLQAQAGAGIGETGTTIGPTGSLPTFAQGAPAAVAGNGPSLLDRMRVGIKAGEGVPSYSGHSPTGALGPYGLTRDFITNWGPRAGLPSDKAMYEGNQALQDKLFDFAAQSILDKNNGNPRALTDTWLTGHPGGTPAPGNMSTQGYYNKVMSAANAAPSGPSAPTSPSASAYAAAPPTGGGQPPPQLAGNAPTPDTQGLTPQLGPVQHGTYMGQDYTYQAPAGAPTTPTTPTTPVAPAAPAGAATVPVPPPPPPPAGQQGFNQPGSPMNPLAAALAQGGNQPTPQIDPTMLAMALSQPNFGGFGGDPFGGFGGGDYGGGFSGGADFGGFGGFFG